MKSQLTRREMIKGSVALAALAFAQYPLSSFGFDDPEDGAVLVPFLDKQPPGKMLQWEQLKTWITPNDQIFSVGHYGTPAVDLEKWNLEISGLIKKPKTLTLEAIKARKKKSVIATLECSGNGSSSGFMGAVGNVKWTGTPLAPLLKECGLKDRATEIVFFGADEKIEEIRKEKYLQNFARSLSVADAFRDDVLLAYEMNGEPLAKGHGAPLRLIVPGWFGIAWVKWLTRIEVIDRRYMSKFMARDYVTIRGEEKDGRTIWRETSVGPIDVKSIIARVIRLKSGALRVSGAAWTDGTPLKAVELKIDDAPWTTVHLNKTPRSQYAWTFWNHDLKTLSEGEHTLLSRAIDQDGNIQPALESPAIKLKKTYWEANQQLLRRIKI